MRLRLLLIASMAMVALVITTALVLALRTPGADSAQHATKPQARPARVLFTGDLASGLERYRTIHPERIQIVDDPHGLRRKAARFTVYDWDVGPTENPRAEMAGPRILRPGTNLWFGWSTLFPVSGFPDYMPGWLTFESIYGPPFRGAGPRHLQVERAEIMWRRNSTYGSDVPWRMPLIRGQWIDFVVHQKMATQPSRGFVELYVDTGGGWRQQLLNGRRRLYMSTLDASNGGGPNDHRLMLYRQRGMFEVATIYHASHRIGTTFRSVAPRSHAR